MTITTGIILALFAGLYGLLKLTLHKLSKSELKVSELQLKLNQGDFDAEVDKAKAELAEAEKENK